MKVLWRSGAMTLQSEQSGGMGFRPNFKKKILVNKLLQRGPLDFKLFVQCGGHQGLWNSGT